MLEPGTPELDATLAEIFAAPPGEPRPEFDLEELLRRAKRGVGLPEEPLDEPGARWNGSGPSVRFLLAWALVALLVAGGAAWHASTRLVEEVSTAQAVAEFTPVRSHPFTPVEQDRLASAITPSLVDVETDLGYNYGGAGTGLLLTGTGEVLTNNHVINGAKRVEVVSKANQRRYQATVLGYDRTRDIALLKIQGAARLSPARIGNSAKLRIGEPIMGIGNAGGLGKPVRAPGTVQEMGVSISTSDDLTSSKEQLNGLVKILADIQPGQSGGPLLNEAGEVVGINTAATVNYSSTVPTSGGVGYAILISDAMDAVRAIRAGRSTDQVHVGPTATLNAYVTGPTVGPDNRALPGTQPGARVSSVGFPALSAGLRIDDTIVSFDGAPVDTPARLTALLGQRAPGDRVTVGWITRDGRFKAAPITLVEGPAA
jgi:S1-C subfamily serine protease